MPKPRRQAKLLLWQTSFYVTQHYWSGPAVIPWQVFGFSLIPCHWHPEREKWELKAQCKGCWNKQPLVTVYCYVALPSGTFWIFIYLGWKDIFTNTFIQLPWAEAFHRSQKWWLGSKGPCTVSTAGVEVCSFSLVTFFVYTDSCSFVLF